MAFRRPDFAAFFEEKYVTVPLDIGDGLFFNPALFHAAGGNRSDGDRVANLLQVSSAFGRPMESLDSLGLVEGTWEVLRKRWEQGERREVEACIGAIAEGYPFPCNLDRRVPAPGGMAPESEQEVLRRGLREGWGVGEVLGRLRGMREDSRA